MYCPRCGVELKIFHENHGHRWLYRMYPCPQCKVIWDWSSKIRHNNPREGNYWRLEECGAWEVVGLPILEEAIADNSSL